MKKTRKIEQGKKSKKKLSPKEQFIRKIVRHCLQIKRLRANEIFIFNVIAKHGSYQIIIGPEQSALKSKSITSDPHARKVEIAGTMHHLFVNPQTISPSPSQEDIRTNLKGSIIMKEVVIHIIDQQGKTSTVKIEKFKQNSFESKKHIDLYGGKSRDLLSKLKSSGKLESNTYEIIQEDILSAIKEHK